MRNKLTSLTAYAGAAFLLLLQTSPFAEAASSSAKSRPGGPPPKLSVQDTPLSPAVKAATSFAPVVKKVAPCVVNIYSTMTVRERQTSNPMLDDPLFRQFFGD